MVTPVLYGIEIEYENLQPVLKGIEIEYESPPPVLRGIEIEFAWPTHGKELQFKSGVKTKVDEAGAKVKEVDN